jgi:predicted transcriptional regulator
MFGWLFGKKKKEVDLEIKDSFSAVKRDMDTVGKWIKHLNEQDKQLFESINEIKKDLSTVKEELRVLSALAPEAVPLEETKQLLEKTAVENKQTAVYDVEKIVQTPVQTASFYDFFKNLSSQERLLLFTIMNSEMKLSYEDLALLLGKEKSTIRGQVNAIKQKKEGLIEEISEKNGKKRVYVPEEIKEKLAKYAKVRVGKKRKVRTSNVLEENI